MISSKVVHYCYTLMKSLETWVNKSNKHSTKIWHSVQDKNAKCVYQQFKSMCNEYQDVKRSKVGKFIELDIKIKFEIDIKDWNFEFGLSECKRSTVGKLIIILFLIMMCSVISCCAILT
jgi:hypothetical protein